MGKITIPDSGIDTGDGDPTDAVRGLIRGIASQQGGTELENTPDSATRRKQLEDGGIREPTGDPRRDDDCYYTPSEYQDRDFGPEDNVTRDESDGDYGGFIV